MTSDNCVGQTDSAAARMVSPRCEFESSSEIREQGLRSRKTENARGENRNVHDGLETEAHGQRGGRQNLLPAWPRPGERGDQVQCM